MQIYREWKFMRRKDRMMSQEFAMEVIDKSRYGLISMIDQYNNPYGIPISIVRDGNLLYFHSAMGGKKVNIFVENPKVSVAFVGETKIPENLTKEELDQIVKDRSKAVLLISSVFTTEFESTIVAGQVELVEDENEKLKAMKLICEKYTPAKMEYFNMAIKAGLSRANVYKIKIEEISSKRKKYDTAGKEMKWERMV